MAVCSPAPRNLAVALLKLDVALFQLLEQPGVLDRDHRLVSEGLQQRDLLRAEWLDLVHGAST